MTVTLPWVFANLSGNVTAADLDQNFNALASAVNAIVVSQGVAINAQTGTTYAVQASDLGKLLTFTNGSAVAVSLPQAVGAFTTPFYFDIACLASSAGTVTLTPAVSTVDGVSTLVLPPGTSCRIVSDGVNYQIQRGIGRIAQVLTTEVAAVATGTTGIPLDNTIPQITEGDQYLSQVIVPTNSASKLLFLISVMGSNSLAAAVPIALFQDATANALAATLMRIDSNGANTSGILVHSMTAATITSTTFKVRIGPQSSVGGTFTLNGVGGVQLFGGVAASSITIIEILP